MKKYAVILIILISAGFADGMKFQILSRMINTPENEFLPVIYKDTLYFRRTVNSAKRQSGEKHEIKYIACVDLFNSISSNNIKTLNFRTLANEQFLNSNPEIDPYEVTTRQYRRKEIDFDRSTPSFFRFYHYKNNRHHITYPFKVEALSGNYTDMHPAFSPDGKYIVFASDRPEGQSDQREKDLDLYISYREEGNEWSEPKNLGDEINTQENEIAPFIAEDGTLYFSSKGYVRDSVQVVFSARSNIRSNNSTSDIFMIEEKKNYNIVKAEYSGNQDSPYINPEILSSPFNTEFNEIGAAVFKDTLIYIASDRMPNRYGYEGYDLYGYYSQPDIESITEGPYAFDEELVLFVTGYYKVLTNNSLKELRNKIGAGELRNSSDTKYIANPDNDYNIDGELIDYDYWAEKVENSIDNFISILQPHAEKFINNDYLSLKVIVEGFADERGIMQGSEYTEQTISNINPYFQIDKNTRMTNQVLSGLRAYYTTKLIKNELLERFGEESRKKLNQISFISEGKGLNKSYERYLPNRNALITIEYSFNKQEKPDFSKTR